MLPVKEAGVQVCCCCLRVPSSKKRKEMESVQCIEIEWSHIIVASVHVLMTYAGVHCAF